MYYEVTLWLYTLFLYRRAWQWCMPPAVLEFTRSIYEPVIRLKGQAKTVVTQRPFSSKEVQSVSLEHNALRSLLPTETQGLQNVLHKIGGTGTFVFLFAQVRSRRLFPGLEVQHVVNGGISTPHTVFLQSMSIYSSPAET